ncbi:MAG: cobalt-precorrin-5B (C(1))-methyltransferase [Synechococcales cyanobacterium CRU_2_2]|nr:cobalt-precorrin-5B (C(1))-methyltransferase [Synechococcales cyanobacterium CRU_2_2]
MARSGHTLPVFACAAAIAALRILLRSDRFPAPTVAFNLLNPDAIATIPIEQAARLSDTMALAITRSDPGDNLDLTRDTPVWAWVELDPLGQEEAIAIAGGEGIGIQSQGTAAIYRYARELLLHHLEAERQGHKLRVTLILPEGRALAERTSNAAFGVVEGLSLLGTSGIAQPLSAPDQLEVFRLQLRSQASQCKHLIFCIGENGLDLAPTLGFPPERLVKTANWLGPLLVEAAMQEIEGVILLGYHGKLIKLAGGIFHTHHQVADGRQEILTAIAADQGLPTPLLQALYQAQTVEAGLGLLRSTRLSAPSQSDLVQTDLVQTDLLQTDLVQTVYRAIAARIDQRATDYVRKHCGDMGSGRSLRVGCILFDRQRQVIVESDEAIEQKRGG